MNKDNIKCAILISSLDCFLFHPLDTIKTRLQTNKFNKFKYNNLYAGLVPSMCNIIPKITFRLLMFDELNKKFNNAFASGLVLGCAESIFITGPTSFFKNNYQISNVKFKKQNLFKSIPLLTGKLMLSNSLFFGIYKTYKTENYYYNFSLSCFASLISTTITYPIDTVRINLQTNKNNDILYNIIQNNKNNLYGGFRLKLFRSLLGKAFVTNSYDYLTTNYI